MSSIQIMTNDVLPGLDLQNRRGWRWPILLAAVWLLTLGIRFYYVTHTVVVQQVNIPGAHGDAVQYYHYALNLVKHHLFSIADPRAVTRISDSFRDPGYPLFLAGWMILFSTWESWYAAILLSQALLGSLTVALWLSFGRRWMTLPWLAAAGLVMAVWPHSVTSNSDLLTETLYGFFVALTLYLFSAAKTARCAYAPASGIGFALAALTNAVSLPFAFLVTAFAMFQRTISTKRAGLVLGATLCLVVPWLIRNALIPVTDVSSSNRASMNFVEGSWPIYHSADMAASAAHDPTAEHTMDQINNEITTFEANRKLGLCMMAERMQRDPGQYVLWYLRKPALMWGWDVGIGAGDIYFHATYHSPFRVNAAWRGIASLCQALNPILMLLATVGCIIGLMVKSLPSGWSDLSLLLVFVTVVHTILQADTRYSTPYRGGEIMLAFAAARWLFVRAAQIRRYSRLVST